MARHNFGPVYHSEAPTSMNMYGWVDDDGTYCVTFITDFKSSESYFNYSWTIYVGYDTSEPIIEIPKDTIGNDSKFGRTCIGKINGKHFHAWAHCGCDGCANNEAPLVIADIDLYQEPSWDSIEVTDRTTRSITVKAVWNDVNNNAGTNDADASISIYDKSTDTLIETKTCYMRDGSDPVTFDGLTHHKDYIIRSTLSDDTTSINAEDIFTNTKTLGCISTEYEIHQYSVMVKFKSTVDGSINHDQTNIVRAKCELLDADLNIINNANITFKDEEENKPANCKVIVRDLISYTDYIVKYYVTDGVNTVYYCEGLRTEFPYIRLYYDDSYHKAIPYVFYNGSYHKAKIFENGIELNGE